MLRLLADRAGEGADVIPEWMAAISLLRYGDQKFEDVAMLDEPWHAVQEAARDALRKAARDGQAARLS